MARPEAVSQAKPGPNRPSQAGPKWRLHDGFGLAWDGEKPKPGRDLWDEYGLDADIVVN
jgi:hypothetical protein